MRSRHLALVANWQIDDKNDKQTMKCHCGCSEAIWLFVPRGAFHIRVYQSSSVLFLPVFDIFSGRIYSSFEELQIVPLTEEETDR